MCGGGGELESGAAASQGDDDQPALERWGVRPAVAGATERDQEIEVEIRNHKDTAITVIVEERVWGDWEILEATHEWKKESAYEVRFTVPVAVDGTSTLRFKVRSQS